jgi:hypothetical protein
MPDFPVTINLLAIQHLLEKFLCVFRQDLAM